MNELPKRDAPIRMLVADGDSTQLHNICLYADCQRVVEVCAAVSTGREVLRLLRDGLCPDVLVLDSLLQDCDFLTLLEQINDMNLPRRPALAAVVRTSRSRLCENLLTMGVDYLILKPYALEQLFHTAAMLGAQAGEPSHAAIVRRIHWHMEALRADYRLLGVDYFVTGLREFVPQEQSCTVEQIYARVASLEGVEADSVKMAMHRALQQLSALNTAEYCEICAYYGHPPHKVLTNKEFLLWMRQRIRRELAL